MKKILTVLLVLLLLYIAPVSYTHLKGEFVLPDTAAFARHLALFINSMQLSLPLLNFPGPRIEEQFGLLLRPILAS